MYNENYNEMQLKQKEPRNITKNHDKSQINYKESRKIMKNHENHKEITKKTQRNQKKRNKEMRKPKNKRKPLISAYQKKKSFQHISFHRHRKKIERKIHNYMVFIWH